MANQEHVAIIKKGSDEWNRWREENPDVKPDLAWANLVGIDLSGINLEDANMKLAFCKGSNLKGARLTRATLFGTNFEGAVLPRADLEGATLEGAHLIKADLSGANLRGVNFKLANLQDAVLEGADLTGCTKLRVDQISTVKTLRNATLDPALLEQISNKHPELFR
jgi:uncharacterized protein YjbI with pentapeptide repeats